VGSVPVILRLFHENERDIFFLLKESFFPLESVQLLKVLLSNHVQFTEDWKREELIQIAEMTIEEYGGTMIPFTLFNIKY